TINKNLERFQIMSTHLPPDAGLYKIDNKDTMRICIFIVKDQGRTFTV
ncbi:6_t:CDS:1, partial [Funneliformis geosporum]